MKQYVLILCLFSCFAATPAQVASNERTEIRSTPSETPVPEEDLVHQGDVIDVDLVGGFEFDWRGRLTPEGYLDGLEGVTDPIYGLCRTETDIAADIAKVYGKTLRDPKIVVRIVDRSNRALARLEGAIKTPTRFRLRRPASLRELIILAGGLTDGASGEITILRPKNLNCSTAGKLNDFPEKTAKDNGPQQFNIKITDLLSGDKAADPQILTGDSITIERATPVYVIGAVNNPKPVYTRSDITVSRAIASAGGLAKNGEGGRVTIFRRESGESRSILVDLTKIASGESVDEVLKPFDIIDVASKGGGDRKYPPVAPRNENTARSGTELPLKVVD